MFSGISEVFTTHLINILEYIKNITGNYGWAIVIFATMVKIVLYYPTQSQYKSMKEMQKIQPMMKKLQEKYKGDPQKLQVEQMALFKKHNVNPLGGCLPLIIQMPILIMIFLSIRKMAETGKFMNETFLWIGGPLSKIYTWIGSSLADKDIPLVLLYGLSMYLSQKATISDPSSAKTQKMMSIMMPVVFTFILWKFPSALILYWLVFNVLSIVQQHYVMRDTGSSLSALAETAGVEISGGTDDTDDADIKPSISRKGRSRSRKKKGGK